MVCCRCGHCKHLTPEYKKLGEAVTADPKLKDRVVVAKVGLTTRQLFSPSSSCCLLICTLVEAVLNWLVSGRSAPVHACMHACIQVVHWCKGAGTLMTYSISAAVSWVQVDADAHRELGERFGVRGFPTIKFFGRGQSVASPEEYAQSCLRASTLAAVVHSASACQPQHCMDALLRASAQAGGNRTLLGL